MKRTPLFIAALLAALTAPLARGDGAVDYRWQNVNAQSLIGVLDRSKTIVAMDGSLASSPSKVLFTLADGAAERPVAVSGKAVQTLYEGWLPIVQTASRSSGLACEMLAFGALVAGAPADVVRMQVRNTAGERLHVELRAAVEQPDGPFAAAGRTVFRGNTVAAVADPPLRGHSDASVRENDWGSEGASSPQVGWASPTGPADPAFRNVTVGWGGAPIRYALRGKPHERYAVVAGFCEGYWSEPGHRILDLRLNGALARTLDPVAEVGHNVPLLVRGVVEADDLGRIHVEVRANAKATDQNAILNAIWLFPAGASVDLTALKQGRPTAEPLVKIACGSAGDHPLTTGLLTFADDLAAGESATFWMRFPKAAPRKDAARLAARSGEDLLADTVRFWERCVSAGAQFAVPSKDVEDFYRASLVYTLLMRDRVGDYYVVKPGATVYNAFWYRDGAYIARSHAIAGLPREAERDLRAFTQSPLPKEVNAMGTAPIEQHPDGVWVAPGGEWDGQGQTLWAILSYYELTGDRAWLRKVYPAIRRGAQWIVDVRKTTKRGEDRGTPHYGLLPRGEGEAILSNEFCFYHDFWGVLGIRKAAEAAEALGEQADARWMRDEEQDFSRCVVDAARKAKCVDASGREYIPAAPAWPEGRIWGDIAAVFPCEVMPLDDPLVASSFERMWDRRLNDIYQFVDGRKVWTYITTDWIQALWMQGKRDRALALFWGYLNHAYTTKGWVEEMFPDSRIGTGDQPHGWAAADFVLLLRAMLVREEGTRLNLMYGIPPEWLSGDRPIEVRRAPTALGGPVSYRAEREPDAVMVTVTRAPRRAQSLRVHLPGLHIAAQPASRGLLAVGPDWVDVPSLPGTYRISVR